MNAQMPKYQILVVLHCAIILSHLHFLFNFLLRLSAVWELDIYDGR